MFRRMRLEGIYRCLSSDFVMPTVQKDSLLNIAKVSTASSRPVVRTSHWVVKHPSHRRLRSHL
jgi:hypothetical protein